MKGITKIALRLMLVFLALIASSTMFFSSPAVADGLTEEEIITELFEEIDTDKDKHIEESELHVFLESSDDNKEEFSSFFYGGIPMQVSQKSGDYWYFIWDNDKNNDELLDYNELRSIYFG